MVRKRRSSPLPSAGASATQPSGSIDWWLLGIVLLLTSIGLMMVFSSGSLVAASRGETPQAVYTYFTRQLLFAGVSIVALWCVVLMPRQLIYRFQYPVLFVVLGLLVLTLTPFGKNMGGASRWIGIGNLFSVQPLEFAKIALALYLAYFMSTKQEQIKTFSRGVFPPYFMTMLFCVLLLLQPDFGGAVMMVMLLFIMCLVGGTRFIYLFISCVIALGGAWFLITHWEYRFQRILAFLEPFKHANGAGYQLVQSYYAFGSGGLTGVGLGAGKQKLFYLPEAHTDFIMAVLGEELGFIGVSFVVFLQLLLFWRCLRIVLRQDDLRDKLSAFAVTMVLLLGTLLSHAVVLGAVPPKGVSMPFLSYGGSGLLASFICVGLILHFSRTGK